MNRNPIATVAASLALLSGSLMGCGDGGTPARQASPAGPLPQGLVVRGKAEGTHVAAAKAAARQGEEIVLVGRIGGSEEPFVKGRAVFTIVDPSLKSCADMDDPDHCKTPWDYCCEDRDAMKRGSATIEIAGPDGRPLPVDLRGTADLVPLATVAVTGTVVERNDAGLLVVRAKRIEVR